MSNDKLASMKTDPVGGPATTLRIKDHPEDASYYLLSDIHVGGIAFNDKAFQGVLDEVMADDNRYVIGLGDYVTGVHTMHPYYEHLATPVHDIHDLNTVDGQFDAFTDLMRPIAEDGKLVGLISGNHDHRFDKIRVFVAKMAKDLCLNGNKVPYLSVSSMLTFGYGNWKPENTIDMFLAHEGRRLPNGAKDIRQRSTNRSAALQRNLEFHFDSADLFAHGHTHELKVVEPLHEFQVTVRDEKGKFHKEMVGWDTFSPKVPKGYKYVHPYSKHYAVTGTFEGQGTSVDVTDLDPELYASIPHTYAQKHNWAPSNQGYVRVDVKDGKIDKVVPVEV